MAIAFNIFIFVSSPNLVADYNLQPLSELELKIKELGPLPGIPSKLKGNAELMLTDEKGSTIIKKLEACIGKPCSITLSSDNLETGVYIYALLINSKIIKSQKMMIIK